MPDDVPVVVVFGDDGTLISQNVPARQLLGSKQGGFCWDVVGGVANGDGFPCQPGCVFKLLAVGIDRSRHAWVRIDGKRHHLACVPVDSVVVCTLSHGAGATPEVWQTLTAREREVLRLLADGETTHSAAEILCVRESTIRSHVEKMRTKLGVNTRAALVASGFRFGYLD
jgi:DNA-binding CsgD family transcriptional regulator